MCRSHGIRGFLVTVFLASCSEGDGDAVSQATLNRAPAATISVTGERRVGSRLTFDGRGSSDPDGDLLFDRWLLVSTPGGSGRRTADLAPAGPFLRTFTPDAPGSYRVRLTASDEEFLATASVVVLVQSGRSDGNGGAGGPLVSLLCPSRGLLSGGDLVTVTGGVFPEGTQVSFGGVLGFDAEVAEEGSEVRVRTPPGAPGIVDVTLELPGDIVILVPGGFTYLPGPLDIEAERQATDLDLERSPLALADLGGGRLLLGRRDGKVQLLKRGAGGALTVDRPVRVTAGSGISRLRPGLRRADGGIDVGAVRADAAAAYVVRLSQEGRITVLPLDFAGEAIDIALSDLEGSSGAEVLVADRAGQRVVVYTAVAGSDGEGFAPTGEFPTGGRPCVIVAAQLDEDARREVVVGSLPGPDVTLIDPSPDGIAVSDQEIDEIDGIALLASGEVLGRGRDDLAAITLRGGGADPERGERALELLLAEDPVEGGSPFLVLDRDHRVALRGGGNGVQATDLDLDGDVDLIAYDNSSGIAIILENTRIDGPESAEQCAAILQTGERAISSGLRQTRLAIFTRSGILALLAADTDGDGLPELAGSHERDFDGLRVMPVFLRP